MWIQAKRRMNTVNHLNLCSTEVATCSHSTKPSLLLIIASQENMILSSKREFKKLCGFKPRGG
ncbi:hypothetical protein Pint_24390 [Pistacia integerrima]|uniref:Uncharacterized protein n=1 Tax=Pistacia integerrima TaxID=434235 RepID=A0ACC0YHI0_9ROSI|nr:hypothetical protein Pint_24390 [Pistacia integerrima]